jgi:hypothetical protein
VGGAESHALSMVAGRTGNNATLLFLVGELRYFVVSSAEFKRALDLILEAGMMAVLRTTLLRTAAALNISLISSISYLILSFIPQI